MNFRFSSTTMRIICAMLTDRLHRLSMPFLPKGICDCVEVWKDSYKLLEVNCI